MTLMENESDLNGYPFGIMEYYNENYFNNGNLLLYMSDLQVRERKKKKNTIDKQLIFKKVECQEYASASKSP